MGTLYGKIGGLHLVDETSVSSDLLTYLRLLPPEGHRPPTSVLQAPLSSALFSSWFHVCPILLMSASISLRQVFLGRPLLRFPCEFHLRACLVITCWFARCVPNPAPSSFPGFVLNRKLVCLVPEVNVANGVRPVYSKNFSQAAIDEHLNFVDYCHSCPPGLRAVE